MPDPVTLALLLIAAALIVLLGAWLWKLLARHKAGDRAAMRRLDQAAPAVDLRGSARPAGHANWVALTMRERDVARLVYAGKTNVEIGSELCISPRTVGTHVSRALKKFGVRRRQQLIVALRDVLPYEDRGRTSPRE